MPEREKVIKGVHDARKYLEDREWVDKSVGVHIDALNDALSLLKEQEAEIAEISDEYLDLGNEIAKMPKAVRCEDCEYSYTEGFVHQHLFCEKHPELGEVADDWFCADGWRA